MRRVKTLVNTALFSLQLLKHCQGGPFAKLSSTVRFTPLYFQHYQQRLEYIHKNLHLKKQRQSWQQQKNTQYYKDIIGKYFKIKKQLEDKGNDLKQNNKNQQMRESLLQSGFKFAFQKMNLFYESLQALVQGRREVLNNENYVFQDGKSVKQKRQNFQKYISRLFGPQRNKDQSIGEANSDNSA